MSYQVDTILNVAKISIFIQFINNRKKFSYFFYFLSLEVEHLRELKADWDQFHFPLQQVVNRAPFLRNAVLNRLHSSADGFSPDNRWILGQTSEV